jgi:pimeloyl-ACP methyl ester carboxylesterase
MIKIFLLVFTIAITIRCQGQNKVSINFKCPCSKIGLDARWADSAKVSCYLIPVPKKSSQPRKGNYSMAVAVASSVNKTDQQPVLYLHGGPGIATLENLPRYLNSRAWKLIREKQHLVFFDYRGTGFSQPALCPALQDSLTILSRTKPPVAEKKSRSVTAYQDCKQKLISEGIDIADFSTVQIAADADRIRKALGIKAWNIYGVSYGTNVALNILRNHGGSIRSVIIDSPFPPNTPWMDFVRPFDASFKVLEKHIREDTLLSVKFSSLKTNFVKAVDRLNKEPVILPLKMKLDSTVTSYKYDGRDFAWSIWTALLSPKYIPLVPLAITEFGSGNDAALTKWALLFSDPNSFGRFSPAQSSAIMCFEQRPKTIDETEEALAAKYHEYSSFITPAGSADAECDALGSGVVNKEFFKPVVSNIPTLIIAGEYDPVCPPLFGAVAAKTLSNATFIIVPAASHSAISADDCIRKIASEFILYPQKKLVTECITKRPKIKFVTSDLETELNKLK